MVSTVLLGLRIATVDGVLELTIVIVVTVRALMVVLGIGRLLVRVIGLVIWLVRVVGQVPLVT